MTPTAANSNDAPAFVIRLEAEIDALLTMIVIEGVAAVDATALSKLIELAITASCPAIAEEAKRLAKQLSSISTVASGSGAQAKELSEAISAWKQLLPGVTGTAAAAPVSASTVLSASRPPPLFSQDAELLQDFIVEAREHLTLIEGQLLVIENDPANFEVMHAIFRAFHTIKGMAGFLELERVQIVAHEVETLLDLARNGKLAISSSVVDVVLASADFLRAQVDGVETSLAGRPYDPGAVPEELLHSIRKAALGQAPASAAPASTVSAGAVEVIPIPEAWQPEVLALPLSSAVLPDEPVQPQPDRRAVPAVSRRAEPRMETKSEAAAEKPQDASSVRVETGKLDQLLNMIGEMVIAQSLVRHHPSLAENKDALLSGNLLLLARITGEIQHATMALRMIPIGSLFQRSARLVRDLARKAGKDVVLQLAGEDTELDKKIAEELSDPLMHMIRNALDHGIETTAERLKTGKPAQAILRLAAYHQSGQIVIEITDDGRGLDREKILRKAIQNHLVQEHAAAQMADDDVYLLIFEPGFSTAEKITDISGRGVGMDVVRKQVQKLHGRIEIKSTLGSGTQFLLKLPLTLAIIDALIVVVGAQRYLVPIVSVRQIFRPKPDMLSTVHGASEMVLFQGHLLPVVRLHERFNIVPRSTDPCEGLLIVTEAGGKTFCLMVDDLLGRQEVVIKGLGDMFKEVSGVSSCAILGDGRVGLILDTDGVFAGVRA
jgi:two-component system chemotaxis sensor kinase CheA